MVMVGVDSAHEVRSITILGSTGSVGCSTVGLIEAERERYVVEAITANRNVDRLAAQARRAEFVPRHDTALIAATAGLLRTSASAVVSTGLLTGTTTIFTTVNGTYGAPPTPARRHVFPTFFKINFNDCFVFKYNICI